MVLSGPGVIKAGPADMTRSLLKILSIMDFREMCSGGLPGAKVLGANQTLEPICFICLISVGQYVVAKRI